MFVTDRKDIKSGDCYCPFNEEQMVNEIPGCDYVVAQNRSEFLDDVDWLSRAYDGPAVKIEKIKNCDGEEITVGVINSEGLKSLKKSLIKEKHKRIGKVKEELDKPLEKVDTWRISYDIYRNSCFYFVSNALAFSNEMSFLDDYLSQETPSEIIITESYDYHV
jgi:hypothetical protein